MNRALFPFILVILAVGLFVFYTDDAYQRTKGLNTELAQYNNALDQSEQVLELRDQLLERRNALPQDAVSRLQLLLPDNIDNIRLIIDINDIASRYHMIVESISLGSHETSNSPSNSVQGDSGGVVGPGSLAVGSVTLGFTVDASYENFLAFLHDLERSLRLVDITNITFTSGGKNADSYSMTITTYWLK